MRKLFHFDSPPGPYRSDACVVSCFDARVAPAIQKFLRRGGLLLPDHVRLAGAAKALASPRQESEREWLIEQVRLSVRLHATRRVLLLNHSDCGLYGGLEAFGGDAARESAHHAEELRRAAETLRRAIPGMAVECYFVDFSGVWEVPA